MVRKSDQGRIDYPVGTLGKIQPPAGNRIGRKAANRAVARIFGINCQLHFAWQTPDTYRTSYSSGYRQWDICHAIDRRTLSADRQGVALGQAHDPGSAALSAGGIARTDQ